MKKITDFAALILVCLTVVGFSAAFFLLPDRAISEKENRALAAAPTLSVRSLFSGEYTAALGAYCVDQFPGRDAFVALKAYTELAFGKRENNGVTAAAGALIARPEPISVEKSLDSIAVFADGCGIPVCVAALPRSADVFADRLPALYPRAQDAQVWHDFSDNCAARSLTAPDLYTPLVESGEYYRTDHHYTTRGAYLAYCALAPSLGYTPYDEDHFTPMVAARDFEGTSMRTSGLYFAARDTIELWRYPGDEDYTVTADGQTIALYDFSALGATDKYAVFLGGNHARVDITASEGRPRLLLIRDSFADALAPFLARHYDLTLIDLRYYHKNVQALAREGYEQVLVLMSITELSESQHFSYLEIPYDRSIS